MSKQFDAISFCATVKINLMLLAGSVNEELNDVNPNDLHPDTRQSIVIIAACIKRIEEELEEIKNNTAP